MTVFWTQKNGVFRSKPPSKPTNFGSPAKPSPWICTQNRGVSLTVMQGYRLIPNVRLGGGSVPRSGKCPQNWSKNGISGPDMDWKWGDFDRKCQKSVVFLTKKVVFFDLKNGFLTSQPCWSSGVLTWFLRKVVQGTTFCQK